MQARKKGVEQNRQAHDSCKKKQPDPTNVPSAVLLGELGDAKRMVSSGDAVLVVCEGIGKGKSETQRPMSKASCDDA